MPKHKPINLDTFKRQLKEKGVEVGQWERYNPARQHWKAYEWHMMLPIFDPAKITAFRATGVSVDEGLWDRFMRRML